MIAPSLLAIDPPSLAQRSIVPRGPLQNEPHRSHPTSGVRPHSPCDSTQTVICVLAKGPDQCNASESSSEFGQQMIACILLLVVTSPRAAKGTPTAFKASFQSLRETT
ncbi:unnamed protein product [Protopolystoma xenopodis]|uniref:Uncharacterized protein n=1 Tax=Protopolystoma xenopodis TaxID=117903 RepID=A0A3S4ZZU9_9PLAT|nr:unnamed protein product [Protopolystoma xenopodis]